MKKIITIIFISLIVITLSACFDKHLGDQHYANIVIELIDDIPSIDALTLDDQAQVEHARYEYDALTLEQQKWVTNLAILEAAELRIIELLFEFGDLSDQQRADFVMQLISQIPEIDKISHADTQTIQKASHAYNLLSDSQKQLVLNADVLFDAIDKLEQLPVFNDIQLFYLSDLHGHLQRDNLRLGMAYVANLLIEEQARDDINTIVIGGGDMLHGTLISNYFHGSSTMHVFNEIGMDAFVIGNHEFNWGLPMLLRYWNGEHEIQANFPLLGANLYYANSNFTRRPQHVDAFTIIENDDGSQVGIIGLIGMLHRSISAIHMDGYVFRNPLLEATEQVHYLQNNFDLDLIVVVIHDGDANDSFGQAMANLGVDVVFSAHDHIPVNRTLVGRYGKIVPTMQAGAHARSVGQVIFTSNLNVFGFSTARLLDRNNEARLRTANAKVAEIIAEYALIIEIFEQTILATANRFHSAAEITLFMSRILAQQYGALFGFHNSGGTRAPIQNNQQISVADVMQIIPFDNQIVVMELQGSVLRQILNWQTGDFVATSSYRAISVNDIDPNEWYLIATHDFIYGRNDILQSNARNRVVHETIIYDLLIYAIGQQGERGQRFDANNEFVPSDDFYAPARVNNFILPPKRSELFI